MFYLLVVIFVNIGCVYSMYEYVVLIRLYVCCQMVANMSSCSSGDRCSTCTEICVGAGTNEVRSSTV